MYVQHEQNLRQLLLMTISNTIRINDNFCLWLYHTKAESTTTFACSSIKHTYNRRQLLLMTLWNTSRIDDNLCLWLYQTEAELTTAFAYGFLSNTSGIDGLWQYQIHAVLTTTFAYGFIKHKWNWRLMAISITRSTNNFCLWLYQTQVELTAYGNIKYTQY